MKTRSKATRILRAMLARRYGFGASPNKQRPGLCGHGGIACRYNVIDEIKISFITDGYMVVPISET